MKDYIISKVREKPKILIITHYFPPQNQVASQRTYAFAKYLSEFGCNVDVLTTKKTILDGLLGYDVDTSSFEVFETNYLPTWFIRLIGKDSKKDGGSSNNKRNLDALKKSLRFIRRKLIGNLFDIRSFWPNIAFKKAKRIIKKEKIDVIISSYGPKAVHVLASKLKKSFPHLFWLADYRDLWSMYHAHKPFYFIKLFESLEEKRIIKRADVITTVSEPLKEKMEKCFKKKTFVIENGFFPEDFNEEMTTFKRKTSKKFILTYTGSIYLDGQNFYPLLIALQNLKRKKVINRENFVLNFYGYNVFELESIISDYDLEDIVNIGGYLSNQEIKRIQRLSDLLLFMEWNNDNREGVTQTKIFEYIISGRPVISVGYEGNASKLIRETNTGNACGNDNVLVEKMLLRYVNGMKYKPDFSAIKRHSRDKLVKELLLIIQDNRKTSK